ncbi:MAG: peroxiredoxin [Acidimicrobiales bacterium]
MDVGDRIDHFELRDSNGELKSSREFLQSGPIVIFFYPAAMTKGCTAESCYFRDLKSEFEAVGAQRIGISMDPVEKQALFVSTYDLDYPILSDPDGAIAKHFGVKRSLDLLKVKRTTFVVDTDRTVLAKIHSETNMRTHAEQALAVLQGRKSKPST